MKVRLHAKTKMCRDDLIPTIKSLVDLTRVLKGILPTLVMVHLASYHQVFCCLATDKPSMGQAALFKLVVGSDDLSKSPHRSNIRLSRSDDRGVKLYGFELNSVAPMWVDRPTINVAAKHINRSFALYVPAEGYHEYSVKYLTNFALPCSAIIVTPGIMGTEAIGDVTTISI